LLYVYFLFNLTLFLHLSTYICLSIDLSFYIYDRSISIYMDWLGERTSRAGSRPREPSINLSIYQSIYQSINLAIYQSIYKSSQLFINLSIHLSIHLFIYVFTFLSTCLLYLYLHLHVYQSIHLSIHMIDLSNYIHDRSIRCLGERTSRAGSRPTETPYEWLELSV